MKTVKCPSCLKWYEVMLNDSQYDHLCKFCGEYYAVQSSKMKVHKEQMKSTVSEPPLKWRKFGDIHWALVIPNNIAFLIQCLIFLTMTIIGIIISPL
jgi:hypothetical protein